VQQQEEDLDADAEGDEDVEGDDGEDDTTLYCFCHKQSFGDVWIYFSMKGRANLPVSFHR